MPRIDTIRSVSHFIRNTHDIQYYLCSNYDRCWLLWIATIKLGHNYYKNIYCISWVFRMKWENCDMFKICSCYYNLMSCNYVLTYSWAVLRTRLGMLLVCCMNKVVQTGIIMSQYTPKILNHQPWQISTYRITLIRMTYLTTQDPLCTMGPM